MEQIFESVIRRDEFERDFKKLLKKFRSLDEDLHNFIKAQLYIFHKLAVDNGGIFQLTGLPFTEPKVYKAKKFACKALKGKGVKSGIRIIYAYFEPEDRIEFIEIYFKGDKVNEDKRRILDLYPCGSAEL
ncbi:MAG: hypothetical protein KKH28_08415 [Elusimicrobia bacterium]|nr:hypothetical protein [Elusimicrobiota bacterium]